MDIVNIFFVSSLAWPLKRKRSLQFAVFGQIWYICLNGSGYPLKKNCHPFEQLGLSVWEKLSSIWRAWNIRLKKLLSVWTVRAIHSKKNLSTDRPTKAICSKINFSWVSIQNHFVAIHSHRTICYSPGHVRYEVCLQMYHYMNSYGSLFLCSHLRFHIVDWLSTVLTYILFNT